MVRPRRAGRAGGLRRQLAARPDSQPGDVAAAVCWLLSDEASWATGDTLFIDGGALTRQYPRFFDLLGPTPLGPERIGVTLGSIGRASR